MGFPPLGPAKVGWDRNRVVGDDTWPRVLHTSHVYGNKEKLLIWAFCWLFVGSDRVPLDCRWVGFPSLGPAEVGWDTGTGIVVGRDSGSY